MFSDFLIYNINLRLIREQNTSSFNLIYTILIKKNPSTKMLISSSTTFDFHLKIWAFGHAE